MSDPIESATFCDAQPSGSQPPGSQAESPTATSAAALDDVILRCEQVTLQLTRSAQSTSPQGSRSPPPAHASPHASSHALSHALPHRAARQGTQSGAGGGQGLSEGTAAQSSSAELVASGVGGTTGGIGGVTARRRGRRAAQQPVPAMSGSMPLTTPPILLGSRGIKGGVNGGVGDACMQQQPPLHAKRGRGGSSTAAAPHDAYSGKFSNLFSNASQEEIGVASDGDGDRDGNGRPRKLAHAHQDLALRSAATSGTSGEIRSSGPSGEIAPADQKLPRRISGISGDLSDLGRTVSDGDPRALRSMVASTAQAEGSSGRLKQSPAESSIFQVVVQGGDARCVSVRQLLAGVQELVRGAGAVGDGSVLDGLHRASGPGQARIVYEVSLIR